MKWERHIGGGSLVSLALILVFACNQPLEAEPADRDTASADPMDTGNVDTDASIDAFDAISDTVDARPDLAEGHCRKIGDCERGRICDDSRCLTYTGCAAFGPFERFDGGAGCLITSASGGVQTSAECMDNADCEESPHGSNCIMKVCTPNEPCEEDKDCPDMKYCYAGEICLRGDAGP